uniref:Uncharacterized protein n=1 Tax=Aegilops tauschii subsp. strangulata TaxID=200361 RepID=A0A453I0J5_AEGTS
CNPCNIMHPMQMLMQPLLKLAMVILFWIMRRMAQRKKMEVNKMDEGNVTIEDKMGEESADEAKDKMVETTAEVAIENIVEVNANVAKYKMDEENALSKGVEQD